MRGGEHDSNQSNSDHHHCEHHQTQNYNKKRTIKKDKNIKEIQAHALKLTKEERAKVQKQKNREAAQRSRDLHKEYVTNLQKQLEELKDHLNKRLCFRCRQQIEPLALDNEIHHHLQFTRKIDESREEICQNNSTENQINLLADEVEMPESFLRMQSQSDFSYIKMMLFISMIAIGVFLYIQPGQKIQARNLVQIYNSPVTEPMPKDDFTIISNDNRGLQKDYQIQKISLMQNNKGLVHKNSVINDQCLESLLSGVNKYTAGIRPIHEQLSSFDRKDGLLLCSYEQPKKYSLRAEANSQLIKMFLIGAEIKQMVTSSFPMNRFMTNSIQLNGIYQISAEVKQVELISQHNCLL